MTDENQNKAEPGFRNFTARRLIGADLGVFSEQPIPAIDGYEIFHLVEARAVEYWKNKVTELEHEIECTFLNSETADKITEAQMNELRAKLDRAVQALKKAQKHLPSLDAFPIKTVTEVGECVRAVDEALKEIEGE